MKLPNEVCCFTPWNTSQSIHVTEKRMRNIKNGKKYKDTKNGNFGFLNSIK